MYTPSTSWCTYPCALQLLLSRGQSAGCIGNRSLQQLILLGNCTHTHTHKHTHTHAQQRLGELYHMSYHAECNTLYTHHEVSPMYAYMLRRRFADYSVPAPQFALDLPLCTTHRTPHNAQHTIANAYNHQHGIMPSNDFTTHSAPYIHAHTCSNYSARTCATVSVTPPSPRDVHVPAPPITVTTAR